VKFCRPEDRENGSRRTDPEGECDDGGGGEAGAAAPPARGEPEISVGERVRIDGTLRDVLFPRFNGVYRTINGVALDMPVGPVCSLDPTIGRQVVSSIFAPATISRSLSNESIGIDEGGLPVETGLRGSAPRRSAPGQRPA